MLDYNNYRTVLNYDNRTVTLDYFRPLMEQYPNLVFTNVNVKGYTEPNGVYIYAKDAVLHGKRFIEVWQHRDYFDFLMQKSIMTEAEIDESAREYKKDNSQRGQVSRYLTYQSDLFAFLYSKLDMIDAAKI